MKLVDTLDAVRQRARERADERRVRDRLQPALLDRLTDDNPQKKSEGADAHMISRSVLRQAVLRDMRWLLNTVNLEAIKALDDLDHVRHSTVNFGIQPLAGKRMSDIEWSDIEDSIANALILFEPRILPESIVVRCVSKTNTLDHHNILSVEIKGSLWCVPYPVEFLFRSDIDLENGYMVLRDLGGA